MKSSATPSLRPFILWMFADVLALADLLLRLTKDHIVWDTVYIPAAVAILFTAITVVYLRRLRREQAENASPNTSADMSVDTSGDTSADTPAEDPANHPADSIRED